MAISLGTRRFTSFVLGLVAIVGLTVGAMTTGISLESLDGPLTILTGLVTAQLGFGSWHDMKVRTQQPKDGGNP